MVESTNTQFPSKTHAEHSSDFEPESYIRSTIFWYESAKKLGFTIDKRICEYVKEFLNENFKIKLEITRILFDFNAIEPEHIEIIKLGLESNNPDILNLSVDLALKNNLNISEAQQREI